MKFAWIKTPEIEWEEKKTLITTALESGIDHVLDREDVETIHKLGNIKVIADDEDADIILEIGRAHV